MRMFPQQSDIVYGEPTSFYRVTDHRLLSSPLYHSFESTSRLPVRLACLQLACALAIWRQSIQVLHHLHAWARATGDPKPQNGRLEVWRRYASHHAERCAARSAPSASTLRSQWAGAGVREGRCRGDGRDGGRPGTPGIWGRRK